MKSDFIIKLNKLSKALDIIPSKMGAEAVRFSKERFQQQNWVDNNTESWKKRKPQQETKQRKGRGILTDSARLRRSIRKVAQTKNYIVIGTDVPYAQIHNEGGRFRATQRVKAHERKTHKRNGVSIKAHKVNGFSRTINVNMPKRQFLGNSAILAKRIDRIALSEFSKALR